MMTARNTGAAALLVALSTLAGCPDRGSSSSTTPNPPGTVDAGTARQEPELPIDPTVKGLSGDDIIQRVVRCWGAVDEQDDAALAACYRDDARIELVGVPGAVAGTGGQGAVQLFSTFTTAFPDLHHDLEIILVNGTQVVVVAIAKGTHTGEMEGMSPTGKPIGLRVAQYLSLDADGLVEVDEHYFDQLTMLGQVGLLPAPVRPADTGRHFERFVVASNSEEEAANLATLKKHGDAFNRHDVEDVIELYSDDAVLVLHSSDHDRTGKQEIGEALAEYLATSSDLSSSVEWMFAAGDFVASRLTVVGTNDGSFPGDIPATGRTFETDELDVYRFDSDGLIIEHHIFSNALQFATQLGLF